MLIAILCYRNGCIIPTNKTLNKPILTQIRYEQKIKKVKFCNLAKYRVRIETGIIRDVTSGTHQQLLMYNYNKNNVHTMALY